MSKKQGSYIGALKVTVSKLTADNQALAQSLAQLGYCHEQQTKFITDSTSGPHGTISQALLFNEAKAALAEAIETNKQLTEDAEFQQHRYKLQAERVGQLGRTCASLTDERDSLRKRLKTAKVIGLFACVLAIGQALQNAGLFTSFIG